MSRPLTEFIYAQNLPWKNGIPGNSKINLKHKTLSIDQDFGDCSLIIQSPKGWKKETYCLDAEEEIFVLDGQIEINNKTYSKGYYACFPEGFVRKNIYSSQGCIFLSFFSKTPIEIIPNKIKPDNENLIDCLNVVEMPWENIGVDPKLDFLGIKRKTLKWDHIYNQKRTFLIATSPHNFPENWECEQISHPCVEEAFMISGDLTGPNGVMNKGSYFWRPENIPHGPFGSYNGSLTLIRFMYGKHKNIWSKNKHKFVYDMPYKPQVPSELIEFTMSEYKGNESF